MDGPARQVFVNEVVGDAALRPAIGLNSAIGQLGAMLGPALGGVLIAQSGSAAAFAANALVCLAVLGMIAAIRTSQLYTERPGPFVAAGRSSPGSATSATGPPCSW